VRESFFVRAKTTLLVSGLALTCLTVFTPSASALTSAEATQKLNECIAAVNDPLYTRTTLPGLMNFANITALENAIANGSLVVWVANGAGVITGSGGANGNGQDLFCGDSNNNDIATMDSDTNSRDYFFGGAGNDRVTGNMWLSTFYGGPGDDFVREFTENSNFYGGPGNDTYETLRPPAFFDQGVDADTTAPTFPSAETFNVAENTTAVATITTSESATITLDSGDDRLKFSLTRLTDSSASLTFLLAPNFEVPTDVGINNVYVVVIKAVDSSSNIGYETLTITVTDVVDTSSFSSFALTGNPTSVNFNKPINLVAVVTVASRITFTANQKRIPGCISKLATGSAGSFTATCSWKPTQRGFLTLSSQSVPVGAGITGAISSNVRIFVSPRLTRR
jgi:hypothetical protein